MDILGKKSKELARERTPTENLAFIQHATPDEIVEYMRKHWWAKRLVTLKTAGIEYGATAGGLGTVIGGLTFYSREHAILLFIMSFGLLGLAAAGGTLTMLLDRPFRNLNEHKKAKHTVRFCLETYQRFCEELKAPLFDTFYVQRHGGKENYEKKVEHLRKLDSAFSDADEEQRPRLQQAIDTLKTDLAFPEEIKRIDSYFKPYLEDLGGVLKKLEGPDPLELMKKREIEELLGEVVVQTSSQPLYHEYDSLDDPEALRFFLDHVMQAVHKHVEEVLLQKSFAADLLEGRMETVALLASASSSTTTNKHALEG